LNTKKSFLGRSARLLRWPLLALLVLFGFQFTLLAFPQLLFAGKTEIGTVALFHDGLAEEQARRLATDIDRRLQGSRFHDSTRRDRLFVFRNRNSYELYRKLTFSKVVPSGFNLPILGNSYVCEAVVAELGDATGGQPRFSIWDGDVAHIAAHEIGHQYIADRIGAGRWRRLPHWKQEGLPEYIANIGDIRADPSLSLASRIEILQDDALWSRAPAGRRPGWDRVHYEAELLVEFLLDVEGQSLEQLISDRVTKDDTYSAMISWLKKDDEMGWTPGRLPDLKGKSYAITGGNSGLGLEAAKILTSKGARVVITARSEGKAKAALELIRSAHGSADVDFVLLDLADADSIRSAAEKIEKICPRLDALINNAGVMQTPEIRTSEGFELQFATNHLGHFRFNSLLFPLLDNSSGRIVPVSSIAHRFGKIALDDLMSTTKYDPMAAYGQSKLANIMYGFELQRRLAARKSSVVSIPCHPGYAATNLQSAGVGMEGGSAMWGWLYKVTNALIAQSAERGAYPLVLAAADPNAEAGAYYGPTRFGDARGPVGKSSVSDGARDEEVARKLWEKTEELVGPFFAIA